MDVNLKAQHCLKLQLRHFIKIKGQGTPTEDESGLEI